MNELEIAGVAIAVTAATVAAVAIVRNRRSKQKKQVAPTAQPAPAAQPAQPAHRSMSYYTASNSEAVSQYNSSMSPSTILDSALSSILVIDAINAIDQFHRLSEIEPNTDQTTSIEQSPHRSSQSADHNQDSGTSSITFNWVTDNSQMVSSWDSSNDSHSSSTNDSDSNSGSDSSWD